MSSVMLAADSAATEDHRSGTAARPALPASKRASVLRRAQGIGSGILFLALRVPVYAGVLVFAALVSVAGILLYVLRAIGLRLTRPAGALAAGALALACLLSPQRAKADTVTTSGPTLTADDPLQQTAFVFGQQTNLYAFNTTGPGTLSVSLRDWGFPVDLQQLSASIMFQDQSWSLTQSPTVSTQWLLTLPVSTGGTFDAFVAAVGSPVPGLPFSVGAYSMTIDFQPAAVPLPPAIDLLLGGMGLLGAVSLVERISRRRNTDVISLA
jgi:hypothetical protein